MAEVSKTTKTELFINRALSAMAGIGAIICVLAIRNGSDGSAIIMGAMSALAWRISYE